MMRTPASHMLSQLSGYVMCHCYLSAVIKEVIWQDRPELGLQYFHHGNFSFTQICWPKTCT